MCMTRMDNLFLSYWLFWYFEKSVISFDEKKSIWKEEKIKHFLHPWMKTKFKQKSNGKNSVAAPLRIHLIINHTVFQADLYFWASVTRFVGVYESIIHHIQR